MKINLDRLEKVRLRGAKLIARCPACAEIGRDKTGDHLVIFPSGLFACAAHQGDREHACRILELAGSIVRSHGSGHALSPKRNGGLGFIRCAPPVPIWCHKPLQEPPQPNFGPITLAARSRVSESEETQARMAAEFGVRVETIRRIAVDEGRMGLFSGLSIGGRLCLPDRIGYIYPQGVKIRHPWGPRSQVRFAWAHGRATEPWRFTLASWRPWVKNYIITEGESDLLSLVDAGMENLTLSGDTAIVASPGTSFREEWAALFKGHNVSLAFDNDPAGAAAARRTAALLRPHAAQIRILNLPTASQP